MEKTAMICNSIQSGWGVGKRSGKWILVSVASVLGFGIIITLTTFFELSAVE
jgi:hypothetical protein